MNVRVLIGVFLVLMIGLCGVGSASVSYSSFDRIITVTDEAGISLSDIDTALGDSSALWKVGETWYCNGSIRSVDSTIYINSTDGAELRLLGNRLNTVQLYGDSPGDSFIIDDFTISSWDNSTSDYAINKGENKLYDSSLNNVTFRAATTTVNSVIGTISNIS